VEKNARKLIVVIETGTLWSKGKGKTEKKGKKKQSKLGVVI